MEDRSAVARLDSGHFRQVVDDTGGNEQELRLLGVAVRQPDSEHVRVALCLGDMDRPALDAISLQFIASDGVQFRRVDAVAGEISVEGMRMPVARLAFIAQQHAAAAAPEHQSRTQSRGTASDDDHVKHDRDLCKTITTR